MTTKEQAQKDEKKYYIMLLIMIITGACNTIFLKLQNNFYKEVEGSEFQHPWFQSLQMFVGESYCAIFWFLWRSKIRKEEDDKRVYEEKEPDERADPPIWVFLISCTFDVIGTTLLNFALTMMPSSIFQMLRGGVVIITCIFTILFIKRKPKNFQWLGVGLVFSGIFLVGLSSQIYATKADTTKTEITGILMLIGSLLFTGFQFVYQEMILAKYRTSPMQLVAWEGIWGLAIFAVLLPIFQFIPCNFSKAERVCASNGAEGVLTLENTGQALKQIFLHVPLIVFTIGQTISIGLFNYFGINIVSYASSATRSVMDSTRTILIWIFFLFVPVQGKTEEFNGLQLAGFFIMLTGQLIYNQLVTVNIIGFDKTKNNAILGIKEAEPVKEEDNQKLDDKSENLLNTKDGSSIQKDI